MPAKPASAGRKLTERARARRAYAPIRMSALSRRQGDADAAKSDGVRQRLVDDVVRLTCSVGQIREPSLAGAEGVGHLCTRRPGDDAPATNVRGLLAERDRPASVEGDEEFLLGAVAVR